MKQVAALDYLFLKLSSVCFYLIQYTRDILKYELIDITNLY